MHHTCGSPGALYQCAECQVHAHLLSTGSTDQGQISCARVRSASAASNLPWRENAFPAATAWQVLLNKA